MAVVASHPTLPWLKENWFDTNSVDFKIKRRLHMLRAAGRLTGARRCAKVMYLTLAKAGFQGICQSETAKQQKRGACGQVQTGRLHCGPPLNSSSQLGAAKPISTTSRKYSRSFTGVIECEVTREDLLHSSVGVFPGIAGVFLITTRHVDSWNVRYPIFGQQFAGIAILCS